MKTFPVKLDGAFNQLTAFFTPRVEAYARENAPWTDQTGNARSGLHAVPFHEPLIAHGVILSHSVPYGIWLEVRFDGKYAIIVPTIKAMGKELMGAVRGLMARIK